MRAGLDDRHAGANRRLEERDERRLPARLEQLANVVELSDVVAVKPETVDLDVERPDRRRDTPRDRVDQPAEPGFAQDGGSALEHVQRRDTGGPETTLHV